MKKSVKDKLNLMIPWILKQLLNIEMKLKMKNSNSKHIDLKKSYFFKKWMFNTQKEKLSCNRN